MNDERRRRRGRRQGVRLAALAGVAFVAGMLAIGGSAAATPKPSVEGSVVFDGGDPAVGVQVDVFDAVDPWTRGRYLGTVTTGSHGRYALDDAGADCVVIVVVAPLGAEFEFAGSGDVYDQQYGCSPTAFRSVLYRDKPPPPPPTTQPPTTQPPTTPPPPPTTQPPTTQPPTTQPPTTKPPAPPEPPTRCLYRAGSSGRTSFLASNAEIYETGAGHTFHLSEATHRFGNAYTVMFVMHRLRAIGSDGQTSAWASCVPGSPIALDVDGSGAVERVSGEFSFDISGDGQHETLGEWFAPTEGILFDTRVAGEMSGAHLFGDQGGIYADGFEKLALLDGNGDGRLAGGELTGLAIWIDGNSNATAEPGEISSLADHQVVALSTSHVDMVSEAYLADGTTMMTEDLWFPVIGSGVGTSTLVRVGALALAGLATVALAFAGSRRRRDGLDAELQALLDNEVRR